MKPKNGLPKQCATCLFLNDCINENCTKEKTCTTKQEPKRLDPDLVLEMMERAGI